VSESERELERGGAEQRSSAAASKSSNAADETSPLGHIKQLAKVDAHTHTLTHCQD